MTPRRSSRARTSQPHERTTRSNNKLTSPPQSLTPQQPSSDEDDASDSNALDEPRTRRQKREREQPFLDDGTLADDHDDEARDGEEEEITRCVCGHQDYPGPPTPPYMELGKNHNLKDAQVAASFALNDTQSEDAGGLFIQCDICKVWQHGGCVGIMDEAMSPDEYFCEECRKDLHKIFTTSRGQRLSRYLPIYEQYQPKTSRNASVSKEADQRVSKERTRETRSNNDAAGKRRSTMNSRAAYEEDEVMRRVIEESKGDGVAAGEITTRRGKRSRDESEDVKADSKRQRTGSHSSSSPSNPHSLSQTVEESDDDLHPSKTTGRKNRNVVAVAAIGPTLLKSQREKEQRERDKDRERERAEVAGRRKGRADRRRGEDPEPADETPVSSHGKDTPSQTTEATTVPAGSIEIATGAATSSSNARRSGRPIAKRGRVGKNQYTKEHDTAQASASPHRTGDNSATAESRTQPNSNGVVGASSLGKSARSKSSNVHRTSFTEMKRRAAVILEYIGRAQLELAKDVSHADDNSSKDVARPLVSLTTMPSAPPAITVSSVAGNSIASHSGLQLDKEFVSLTSVEMMDVLSRDLVLWQKHHSSND